MQQLIENNLHEEMKMQNYIDALEERTESIQDELVKALAEKREARKLRRAADRSKEYAKERALRRLDKWHAKRYLRRVAEDEVKRQSQAASKAEELMQKYKKGWRIHQK